MTHNNIEAASYTVHALNSGMVLYMMYDADGQAIFAAQFTTEQATELAETLTQAVSIVHSKRN